MDLAQASLRVLGSPDTPTLLLSIITREAHNSTLQWYLRVGWVTRKVGNIVVWSGDLLHQQRCQIAGPGPETSPRSISSSTDSDVRPFLASLIRTRNRVGS